MSGLNDGIVSCSVRSPKFSVKRLFSVHWSWTYSDRMFESTFPRVPMSSTW
jgi:hypothetical protein